MIATSTTIRIRLGIRLRRIETARLLRAVTNINAAPITSEFSNLVVTAKAEHIPNVWQKMGFSAQSPPIKVDLAVGPPMGIGA